MPRQLTPHVFVMKHNHDTDRPALGLIAGKTTSLVVDGGNTIQEYKGPSELYY